MALQPNRIHSTTTWLSDEGAERAQKSHSQLIMKARHVKFDGYWKNVITIRVPHAADFPVHTTTYIYTRRVSNY